MTAEIITPNFNTTLDVPVERVLDGAAKGNLESVIVIGRTKDDELYLASSMSYGPEILWMIENAKGYVLNADRA